MWVCGSVGVWVCGQGGLGGADMHVFGEGSESWLKMRKSKNWSTRHCRKLRVWNFPLFLLVVHFFPSFFSCSALCSLLLVLRSNVTVYLMGGLELG